MFYNIFMDVEDQGLGFTVNVVNETVNYFIVRSCLRYVINRSLNSYKVRFCVALVLCYCCCDLHVRVENVPDDLKNKGKLWKSMLNH